MDEIIRVSHLGKNFGPLEVLKDISFTLERGKVLSVIGPSGGGKSTLLRCITCLDTVSRGSIDICGKNIVHDDPKTGQPVYAPKKELRKIMLGCGLVFQNFNLFPHLSVLENISEAQIHVLHRSKREAEERSLSLLEKMGLEDKAAAYPCQLSGGQQQRVSIARALALNPQVLCFDEPTSALDPLLTREILNIIKSLAKENMTMITVTHEMGFAKEISDEIIFMDNGVIAEQGSPDKVFNRPENERTRNFIQKFGTE